MCIYTGLQIQKYTYVQIQSGSIDIACKAGRILSVVSGANGIQAAFIFYIPPAPLTRALWQQKKVGTKKVASKKVGNQQSWQPKNWEPNQLAAKNVVSFVPVEERLESGGKDV